MHALQPHITTKPPPTNNEHLEPPRNHFEPLRTTTNLLPTVANQLGTTANPFPHHREIPANQLGTTANRREQLRITVNHFQLLRTNFESLRTRLHISQQNPRQPTSNHREPTSNHHEPTSNQREPTLNHLEHTPNDLEPAVKPHKPPRPREREFRLARPGNYFLTTISTSNPSMLTANLRVPEPWWTSRAEPCGKMKSDMKHDMKCDMKSGSNIPTLNGYQSCLRIEI